MVVQLVLETHFRAIFGKTNDDEHALSRLQKSNLERVLALSSMCHVLSSPWGLGYVCSTFPKVQALPVGLVCNEMYCTYNIP